MGNKLYVVRGLPGAGKSTFAKRLQGYLGGEGRCLHIEADMFHVGADGVYRYVLENAEAAHRWCFEGVRAGLLGGKDVVVSNTSLSLEYLMPYVELGKECGVGVEVILVKGSYPNVHEVPEDVLVEMRGMFEVYPGEKVVDNDLFAYAERGLSGVYGLLSGLAGLGSVTKSGLLGNGVLVQDSDGSVLEGLVGAARGKGAWVEGAGGRSFHITPESVGEIPAYSLWVSPYESDFFFLLAEWNRDDLEKPDVGVLGFCLGLHWG